jgi:hypothetical protein
LILNLLQKLISLDFLILAKNLHFAYFLFHLSLLHLKLLNFFVSHIQHLGKLVLANSHLSKYLPLSTQLTLCLILVDGKPAVEFILHFIFLALELADHLVFKVFLGFLKVFLHLKHLLMQLSVQFFAFCFELSG